MNPERREFYIISGLVVAFLIGVALWIYLEPYRHGGSLKKFDNIHDGMSYAQVAEIMGEPSRTNRYDDGTTLLTYGHSKWTCHLRVTLSQDGSVTAKQHAHNPAGPPEK